MLQRRQTWECRCATRHAAQVYNECKRWAMGYISMHSYNPLEGAIKDKMPIQAVIFDIGGVLVRTEDWSGRRKWEERLGLAERGLSTLVFDSETAIKAASGAGPDSAIWRYVGDHFGLDDEQVAQLRTDFWSGDRPNTELLHFISNLRARVKTGILSNAWPEMRDMNEGRFGLAGVVDETVYSFQIGVLKPDLRAYQIVLQRLGVAPEQSVFVDDYVANCDGARAAGMFVVHFANTAQSCADLCQLLEMPDMRLW